ncbi:MAG TPA: CGNR zinc finger domain-containing protein [Steroidobacteraceae bacterium]|jgi:predicted RNA-binding Zn ribbon-like protein|nr:CGNR zinc finger domain-containing protein [Steroidobacteraceae bacterium]
MSHTEKPLPDPLFIADHRAIDFLNTVATPGPEILDWLRDGASFMSWLRRGFTVPDDLKVPPANLERLAAEARELREWFRGFVEKHAGRPLKPSVAAGLRPLNELLQRGQIHIQISAGAPLVLDEVQNWRAADALLQPIARAMADVLVNADFTHVGHCEGAQCTLWFLDVSKSHRRRWCSMSVCGNRAKAAQHRARHSV